RPETAAGLVATIWELSEALGIEPHDDLPDLDDEISALVADGADAGARGAYGAGDATRETLKARGIVLEDTPGGTVWRRVKPDEIGGVGAPGRAGRRQAGGARAAAGAPTPGANRLPRAQCRVRRGRRRDHRA